MTTFYYFIQWKTGGTSFASIGKAKYAEHALGQTLVLYRDDASKIAVIKIFGFWTIRPETDVPVLAINFTY